jgi:hypothetical protein
MIPQSRNWPSFVRPVILTIEGRHARNENLYRTTEPASGHPPFSSLRPRAHIRVFAWRRAAVDSETTRSLRTGCDAPLQSVHPGRSACLSLHVRLPALSQPRLLRRILRRPEKEDEATQTRSTPVIALNNSPARKGVEAPTPTEAMLILLGLALA